MATDPDGIKARNEKILELRRAGKTLEEIGQEMVPPISRQRVQVIVKAAGFADRLVAVTAKRAARQTQSARADDGFDTEHGAVIERLLAADTPPQEIAARLASLGHKVTEADIRRFAERHGLITSKPVASRFGRQVIRLAVLAAAASTGGLDPGPSDAALLEAEELNALRGACGQPGEFVEAARLAAAGWASRGELSITKDGYEAWRMAWLRRYPKEGPLPWPPTHLTVMKQLGDGTWNGAIRGTGLTPNTRGRTRGLVFYTADAAYEEAAGAFVAAATAKGVRPTVAEYEKWSRGRRLPSAAAMRNQFRRWAEVVRTGAAHSGTQRIHTTRAKKTSRPDQLAREQLLDLRRSVANASAALDSTANRAEAAHDLKETIEPLIGEVVTSFEGFRRQWILAAAIEDPSAFALNLAPGGRADPKERKTWAPLHGQDLPSAIPRVINDLVLDRLTGVPSGSVRDGGGWLGPAREGQLATIDEREVRLFRVLKAARNVIQHNGSENSIRNFQTVVAGLDPVSEAPVHEGAQRVTSKDLVIRWLSAKSNAAASTAQGGAVVGSRLGYLLASLERVIGAMIDVEEGT